MRTIHALAGLCLASCLVPPSLAFAAATQDAALTQRHKFHIQIQPLSSALRQLATQSGVRILFPYDEVAALRSRPVQGWLSTGEALDRLLAGTDLKMAQASAGVIALAAPPSRNVARRNLVAVQYAQVSVAGSSDSVAMTPAPEPIEDSTPIIVTGTRATTRTVADSLAPIDVLGAKDLEASGKQSVRDLLGTLVPSINVSNSGAGASFAVKTLSLRGLAGDQLLVLVNGKRRHNTATLFINGTTQNGQSPPDLDLIPSSSIERIEVLRDGASAQYGSDAIAGVVNIILKSDTNGSASLMGGGMADGGGEQGRMQVSKGFAIGDGGHVHMTLDAFLQGRTYRSAPNPGQFYAKVGSLYPGPATGTADPRELTVDRNVNKGGQPQVSGINFAYDAALPVSDMAELYLFGSASRRHSDAWLTYRFPDASNNMPELFPNGYSPHLHIYDEDFQVSGGVRGDLSDTFHYDLSSSFSRNWVKYRESSVINASLGPASPTDMYVGSVTGKEWTSNLDLQKSLEVGLVEPLLIAVGAEYRWNSYAIGAGDPESYVDGGYRSTTGPNAGVLRTSGSQGVTGFPDTAAGEWSRNNWSAYLNLEQKIMDGLEIALAGRHEDYSDFGTTDTGKASIRIAPVDGIAIRGTASTGFRAPTLQQQHYSSASTINVGVLLPVSALPVDSSAAIALGATPLKAEKSTNFSAGIVLTPLPRLNITVDAYQIKIKDRILLSETLQGTLVRSVLAAAGITSSAGGFYFSNAADTRTRGLDIVSTYRADLGEMGSATVSLSANFNKTIFTHVDAVPDVLASSGLVLIGRSKQGDFTKGTPRDKQIANILWNKGPASLNLRATRYGTITQVHPTTPSLDAKIDPKVILDLELGFELRKGIKLSAGANNLLNSYPNKLPAALQGNGFSLYNQYSPYGTSGGFYYGRLSLEF